MLDYSVIIVDDEPIIRNTLKTSVPWQSMRLHMLGAFSDGDEAIDYLTNNYCDIVLSDIVMSRISGLELAKWLNRHRRETRMIFLSGYSEFELAQEACALGASRYLLKPIEPRALYRALADITEELDRERESHLNMRAQLSSYTDSVLETVLDMLLTGQMQMNRVVPILNTLPLLGMGCILTDETDVSHEESDRWPAITAPRLRGKMRLVACEQLDYVSESLRRVGAENVKCFKSVYVALEHLVAHEKIESACETKSDDRLIAQVLEYLKANYSEDLTFAGLAQSLFLSTSHLSHLIKQKTGSTFVELLTQVRMEQAVRLLSETHLNITSIGKQVGYRDTRYFSKVFTRYFGITPMKYRRRSALTQRK